MFKKCYKSLDKSLKQDFKKYFSHLETEAEKTDLEDLLLDCRDSLVDLSLNYSSVKFLDHTSFLDLSGNHSEMIEYFFPTAGQVTIDQESDLCLNHPFILFKDNFMAEAL